MSHGPSHEGSALLRTFEGDESDLRRHTPLLDHLLGNAGNLLDVVRRSGGHEVLAVDELLRESAAKGHGELRLEVLLRVHAGLEAGLLGREEGKSSGSVRAGDDRDLLDLVVVGDEGSAEGVSGLVVGDQLVLALAEGGGTAVLLEADHYPVNGRVDLLPSDSGLLLSRGRDGGLVHQVLELGSGESRRAASDGLEVYIRLEGLAAGVDAEDAGPSLEVGKVYGDLAVESAGTEKSLVEDINAVGSGDGDDSGVAVETVHLNKDLVDGLLALVVTAGESGTTLTSDSIDLVNEDDAGGVLLGLGENVTDTASSNTDEHLNELGTGDRNERDSCLAGNGLGEQSLTCRVE